ncbi:hypothetical protein ACFQVC_01465 [Streptomyces monticola]|uniref:Uncharacterized protein n=1 Tax=Streptomyces monticola TaxID=2666263 RepID=A0ABW2JA54_9ACTN
MIGWPSLTGLGFGVLALCPVDGGAGLGATVDGVLEATVAGRVGLCAPEGGPEKPVLTVEGEALVSVPPTDRPVPPPPPPPARPEPPPVESMPPDVPPVPPAPDPEDVPTPTPPPRPPAPGPALPEAAVPAEPAPVAPPPVVPRAEDGPRAEPADRAFAVRPYRSTVLRRPGPDGMSPVTMMVVMTVPAVLAAAALRPHSSGSGGRRSAS